MNKFTVCVSLNEFIRITMGEIFSIAPGHKPRFINEIRDKVVEGFKLNCHQVGSDFFYHDIQLKDLYKFISDILMSIGKFRELNLSQREFDNGVDVDDERRNQFVFTDRYSSIPEYDDFVDLDACIQNIFSQFELHAFSLWHSGEIDIEDLRRFRKAYQSCGGEEHDT